MRQLFGQGGLVGSFALAGFERQLLGTGLRRRCRSVFARSREQFAVVEPEYPVVLRRCHECTLQAVATTAIPRNRLEQQRRRHRAPDPRCLRGVAAGTGEVEAAALVSAKSALEATEAGFEVGTRTIVDVLLSQQQQFAAEREYVRAPATTTSRQPAPETGRRHHRRGRPQGDQRDAAQVPSRSGQQRAPSGARCILRDQAHTPVSCR